MKSQDRMEVIGLGNLATFDLNLLRVFDALMRESSVSRAGDRLALSQPAVSGALSRLRHALGDPLFVRVGNDMVPTPHAEAIAGQVREILAGAEEVLRGQDRFDPATAELTFTLRGADFFSMRLMPALFAAIAAEAPGVRLRFLDGGYGDLFALLRDGEVDLALERPMEVPGWVSSDLIFPSPFVIVAARGNRRIAEAGLSPGAPLPIELFAALPHAIRSADGSMAGMVDDALATRGHSRRVLLALPHFEAVALAVAEPGSDLIAAVPQQLAEAIASGLGLEVYEPPFAFPVPDMQMYWHRRNDRLAQHLWLRGHVTAQVRKLWPDRGDD